MSHSPALVAFPTLIGAISVIVIWVWLPPLLGIAVAFGLGATLSRWEDRISHRWMQNHD